MALFGRESAQEQQRVEAWQRWVRKHDPLALASVALSIFSLTHFGTLLVDAIAGIALGVVAIRSARRSAEQSRRGSVAFAYLGIAIGAISLAFGVFLYTRRPG
jgi:lipopolysaccharide export LptBFGC system permease protein LptF